MTRPRQGSQNRQAAGRVRASRPSHQQFGQEPSCPFQLQCWVSSGIITLHNLKCLLPSPERMWRSWVFCPGSRTSGLRGSGRRKMPFFLLLAEQKVWLLSSLERRPLTRASRHSPTHLLVATPGESIFSLRSPSCPAHGGCATLVVCIHQ